MAESKTRKKLNWNKLTAYIIRGIGNFDSRIFYRVGVLDCA
ncbi:hypothetical protein MmiEs2_12580 [Methanimicrococcus stummii]|uniref:Uncharacterized protein n=1 Tax=Methanimicrococcus stummii TaxID=3028294 RepID=A0AA96ZXJ5_9EURY|nr:hypothetical protein [Methanimicrococcus sp. Es2]WNY29044.1 hypothetical protein MmiEs2_12580 [Methanimicrococcus sp. Es2]